MIIAIVVLSMVCAELAVALGVMIYKYHKIEKSDTVKIAQMILTGAVEDAEEAQVDLSYPNTEGGF